MVHPAPDGTCLLYIDRHLVHEVTSPQAFEGLRMTGRKVRSPEKTLAVVDHNVPTTDRSDIDDPKSALQVQPLPGTPRNSASNISASSITARASSISSGPSKASRFPAQQ